MEKPHIKRVSSHMGGSRTMCKAVHSQYGGTWAGRHLFLSPPPIPSLQCHWDAVSVLVSLGYSVGIVRMQCWHQHHRDAVSASKLWMLRDLQCQQLHMACPTLPT